MGINIKFSVSRKSLLLMSLFVVALVSLFVCLFVNNSIGASLENVVHVRNETELKNAINNAPDGKSTTITIDNDITLTETLKIPANKAITLTSSKIIGYYKLIGAEGKSTVLVDRDSVLKIDGIIATHTKFAASVGGGVYVEEKGRLILYNGEISNNEAVDGGGPFSGAVGGGVYNRGVFEMYGGAISNNQVYSLGSSGGGSGGGVFNAGVFTMSGGEITGNTAHVAGGGVHNTGTFTMSGGEITGNTAENWGGGVSTFGVFERLGGVILGNDAKVSGNNVHPDDCDSGSSNGSDGNGGFFDGGDGGSSNGDNGAFINNGGLFVGGFSLREFVFLCVGVGGLVVGVVGVVLFFASKKEVEYIKGKNNR